MRKSPRKASTCETIKVHDLLKQHIIMTDSVDNDGNRLAQYADGMDDLEDRRDGRI